MAEHPLFQRIERRRRKGKVRESVVIQAHGGGGKAMQDLIDDVIVGAHVLTQLIVDVCSVKVHPAKIMAEELSECELIATHPMFGPDSAARGLTELKLAFCPLAASPENQNMVRYFWETKGVEVIETTPEEHDRQAAYSQAMPYIIAHALNGISLPELTFPTRSSRSLYDIAHYSAKDSEQLFRDMLAYNPFVQAMLDEFEPSMTGMLELARNIAGTSV